MSNRLNILRLSIPSRSKKYPSGQHTTCRINPLLSTTYCGLRKNGFLVWGDPILQTLQKGRKGREGRKQKYGCRRNSRIRTNRAGRGKVNTTQLNIEHKGERRLMILYPQYTSKGSRTTPIVSQTEKVGDIFINTGLSFVSNHPCQARRRSMRVFHAQTLRSTIYVGYTISGPSCRC